MPVIEERYDQNKIDSLKRYLKREADKGRTKDYEITVDGFKVVSRTDEIDEFDDYEEEIKDNTRNISILIYDGQGTNRNTRYSFALNQDNTSPIPAKPMNGIGGLGEIDEIIQQKLDEKDKDFKISMLEKDLAETKQKLFEAEQYHQQLQEEITFVRDSKPKPTALGVTLADFGTVILDGLLKKNIPQLAGVLNGMMPQQEGQAQEAQGEATFQRQGDGQSPQLTEKQLQYLGNLEAMEEAFTPEQMAIAMVIMRTLMGDPGQLIPVAQLLNLHNSDEQV